MENQPKGNAPILEQMIIKAKELSEKRDKTLMEIEDLIDRLSNNRRPSAMQEKDDKENIPCFISSFENHLLRLSESNDKISNIHGRLSDLI